MSKDYYFFFSPHPILHPFLKMMSSRSVLLPTIVASIAALAVLAPLISSAPQQSPATALAFSFPADAETLLKTPLKSSFSCEGKAYGYYADVDNNCQVFHICLPIEDDAGAVLETAHWSFICGNQTVFDQATLTCNHEADAFPCAEAPTLYGAVEFGKIDA